MPKIKVKVRPKEGLKKLVKLSKFADEQGTKISKFTGKLTIIIILLVLTSCAANQRGLTKYGMKASDRNRNGKSTCYRKHSKVSNSCKAYTYRDSKQLKKRNNAYKNK